MRPYELLVLAADRLRRVVVVCDDDDAIALEAQAVYCSIDPAVILFLRRKIVIKLVANHYVLLKTNSYHHPDHRHR